jgi:hypothetical protein
MAVRGQWRAIPEEWATVTDIAVAVTAAVGTVWRYRRLAADPRSLRVRTRRTSMWATAGGVFALVLGRSSGKIIQRPAGSAMGLEVVELPRRDNSPPVVRLCTAMTVWALTETLIGRRETLSSRRTALLAVVPAVGLSIDYAVAKRSRLRRRKAMKARAELRRTPTAAADTPEQGPLRIVDAGGGVSPVVEGTEDRHDAPSVSRSLTPRSGWTILRWLYWQTLRRTGTESLLETRISESDKDGRTDQARRTLPHGVRLLPPKHVVVLHAALWGTGEPLCGARLPDTIRLKQPWGHEPGFGSRLRRCHECLQLCPVPEH